MTTMLDRSTDLSVPAPRSAVDGECKKAWKNHGSAMRVPVDHIDPQELDEEIACCPPADDTLITSTTDDAVIDLTSPTGPIATVSPREQRRLLKLRLMEEDKRKRASEPKKGTTHYCHTTKSHKHGRNIEAALS
jgi:hypothetical protein